MRASGDDPHQDGGPAQPERAARAARTSTTNGTAIGNEIIGCLPCDKVGLTASPAALRRRRATRTCACPRSPCRRSAARRASAASTSPRSLVTSRMRRDDRLGEAGGRGRRPRSAASCGPGRPPVSTTRRARLHLGVALHHLRHLRGVHEHALHLGRLVGAPHPALDAHVGAAARARARAAPPTDRRWRSGSAGSRD